MDGCTGQLRSKAPLDFETMPDVFPLPISVYDSEKARLSLTIVIEVVDVNEPPVFAQSDFKFAVNENSLPFTVIGTVVASDPDQGDQLTYSMSMLNASSPFEIDSNSGEVTLTSTATLDFETQASYQVILCVSDSRLETCATAVVTVVDVNEPPICKTETRYVDENSAVGTVLSPPFYSIDVDAKDVGTSVSYALIDDQGLGEFTLNAPRWFWTVVQSTLRLKITFHFDFRLVMLEEHAVHAPWLST